MGRLSDAILFATEKHSGQLRKWTGVPYITHPLEVMTLLLDHGITDEYSLCAAVLHDVVEDTDATLDDIHDLFGPEVAGLVDVLTDPPLSAGNRATRKQIQRDRISQACKRVQSIKCADVISNSFSIRAFDANFWPIYQDECQQLVDLMWKARPSLRNQAYAALSVQS